MKLNTKIRRPSASMVVATTALVIAAGGAGAFAATQINGNQIKAKTITNKQMANNAISNRNLQSGSVLASTLAPSAITTRFREAQQNLPALQQATLYIACQDGEDIVGGGFGGIYPTSVVGNLNPQAHVAFSRPSLPGGGMPTNGQVPTGWAVSVVNESNTAMIASAYAVCLKA
jgi:hypothetical protein